jgi:hypothetical protein
MMAKRKKAPPGAGRKPQGEFSRLDTPFSLRMPAELREQLDNAAKDSGRSVSQEMLDRLNKSFGRDRDKGRDPGTRAICFLLAEVVASIGSCPAGKAWHHDAFQFQAFKIAVAKLLDDIAPKGEAVLNPLLKSFVQKFQEYPPTPLASEHIKRAPEHIKRMVEEKWKSLAAELAKRFDTPESAGLAAAEDVLSKFYGISDPRAVWQEISAAARDNELLMQDLFDNRMQGLVDNLLKKSGRTWYGMADARRDLQVTETGGNNGKHT